MWNTYFTVQRHSLAHSFFLSLSPLPFSLKRNSENGKKQLNFDINQVNIAMCSGQRWWNSIYLSVEIFMTESNWKLHMHQIWRRCSNFIALVLRWLSVFSGHHLILPYNFRSSQINNSVGIYRITCIIKLNVTAVTNTFYTIARFSPVLFSLFHSKLNFVASSNEK